MTTQRNTTGVAATSVSNSDRIQPQLLRDNSEGVDSTSNDVATATSAVSCPTSISVDTSAPPTVGEEGIIQAGFNDTEGTRQTKLETSSVEAAVGRVKEGPNIIEETTQTERWSSGIEESWKEEEDSNACKESLPPSSTTAKNIQSAIRGTEDEEEEVEEGIRVGAFPSQLPPLRGLLKNRANAMEALQRRTVITDDKAKDAGKQHQSQKPSLLTPNEKHLLQKQDLDVTNTARKRAIMENEDIGVNDQGEHKQEMPPPQPTMFNKSPMDDHHHHHQQLQELQQNKLPLITNQELLPQKNRESVCDTTDVVLKRSIMANEEIRLNERVVLAPQPPPEPVPRQDQRMPTETGAFSGGPGEGLHPRDDIRFSLVGIDLSGEQITDDVTALGGLKDGALDPVHTTLQIIDGGNNNTKEASGDRLAEAMPVEDDELPDMEATPYDVEAATKRKLEQAKEWKKRFLVLGLVFVCLVAGASTGAVYHRKKKEEEQGSSPTVAPSFAPTNHPSSAPSGALDLLKEGLAEYTKANLEIFDSPQWKAWDWLENHPDLSDMEEWRKRQLFALTTFYYSMDGDNWRDEIKDGWLLYDRSECLWSDTAHGNFDPETGEWEANDIYHYGNITVCNERDEFLLLDIMGLELSGRTPFIPPEVTMLTSLSKLALFWNDINASLAEFLPSHIYQTLSLETLNLHHNDLNGQLPSELGLMTSLAELILNTNTLDGSLPSELGSMTRTTRLFLHRNRFNGSIPSEVGRMTSMEELSLYGNALNSPLPSELGLMTSTTRLYLYSNSLSGAIPTEVGRMANMVDLLLNTNSFSGSVPSELALLTTLEKLRLEDNVLMGTVPIELESLRVNGSLIAMAFANNSLSGTIPEGLCSMGLFDEDAEIGLSFDCSDMLCGCCWCPCPGTNYSNECETNPFIPSRDDVAWPGAFPLPLNRPSAITINIRTDEFPSDIYFEWSVRQESGFWKVKESEGPSEKEDLHSYTYEVASDSSYRLKIIDEYGDGSCCNYGLGWFTITSSIPSNDYVNGTVIWEAAGHDVMEKVEVFLSTDPNGHAKLEKTLFYEETETEGLLDGLANSNFTHDEQGEV